MIQAARISAHRPQAPAQGATEAYGKGSIDASSRLAAKGRLEAQASTNADAMARRDLSSTPQKRYLWRIRRLTVAVCKALYSITTCSRLQRISIMPHRPTRREIAEQDHHQLMRQAVFRLAADAVAAAFAAFAEVR